LVTFAQAIHAVNHAQDGGIGADPAACPSQERFLAVSGLEQEQLVSTKKNVFFWPWRLGARVGESASARLDERCLAGTWAVSRIDGAEDRRVGADAQGERQGKGFEMPADFHKSTGRSTPTIGSYRS
jgi:hypothetical protein